jgi:asparagine synthase (glutamine-hydrolysing)
MILAADDRAWLLIDRRQASADDTHALEAALSSLTGAGWRCALQVDGLEVWLGARADVEVRQVHRRHILIGRWIGDPPLAALIGVSRSPAAIARAAVGGGSGRYVLAWREEDGRLALLRDPGGALDCVWWRFGGLRLASDQPPRAADGLLPVDLAIDWEVLGEIAESPGLLSDRLALRGLHTVTPGDVVLIDRAHQIEAIWRPADFYRPSVGWDDRPGALRDVVDEAVREAVRPHDRVFGEISGGLDSAIVSSSLAATGERDRARFINYYGDWSEGDERVYAFAAAAKAGLPLQAARKPVAAVTAALLEPLGWGIRPALHGVDVAYDRDVARRMARRKATALLTGQGGDAVFFQAPDPQIVIDRRRRERLAGFRPGYWAEVGRWTRHSAWTIAGLALNPPRRPAGRTRRHAWLADTDDMPPAKYGQILRLANCQLFWGDCLRARTADLLHPLLTQPVMEHCLSIPADRLALGVRDRGLARQAFADRLPASIRDRRDKGDLSQFYGHVVQRSLPEIRTLLLEGLLASHRLLDPVELDRDLTPERLTWSQTSNRHLLHAVLEVWARSWTERIEARRWAQISTEPVEDVRIKVA